MLPPRRGPPLSLSSCPPLAMGRDGRVCGVGCDRSVMCWTSLTCPDARRHRAQNESRSQTMSVNSSVLYSRLCAFPLCVSHDHHRTQTKQRSCFRCAGDGGGPPPSLSSSSPLGMGRYGRLFTLVGEGWIMERFAHPLYRSGRRLSLAQLQCRSQRIYHVLGFVDVPRRHRARNEFTSQMMSVNSSILYSHLCALPLCIPPQRVSRPRL